MKSVKPLLGTIILGIGLSAAAHGQANGQGQGQGQGHDHGSSDNAANGMGGAQLAERFSRLDSNGDGVLSLEEFRQMRDMMPPQGERTGQMTPEQREQMQERMQNMTPEQREQMQERMQNMTPEQREQMQERMQNMTPEQREQMQEQMRQRRGQEDAAHDHDHNPQ